MGTGTEQLGVVILGATSAIARAIARRFAVEGYPIVLAARDVEEAELIAADLRVRHEAKASVLPFDAFDTASHVGFVDLCRQRLSGELGGVVLCFGHMEDQQAAQRDSAAARRILDGNFLGAVSILDHFANYFEARGRGFIAALSSVAGDRGRASNYYYGAAKAGLSTYLQGLRNRLYRSGVSVTNYQARLYRHQNDLWAGRLVPGGLS